MAESAPNTTTKDTDLFDKGFGRGAAKAREETARLFGLNSPEEIAAFAERIKKQEADRLAAEGKTNELLSKREKELADERNRREALEAQNRDLRFETAFRSEALRNGLDADLAYLLVRPEERVLDESGKAVGVSSLVARIAKERPHLRVGTGSGPVGGPIGNAGGADTSEKGKRLTDLRARYEEAKKDHRVKPETIIGLTREIQALERETVRS